MSRKTVYIDGVNQCHFVNGMVFLDSFLLEPQQNGDPVQGEGPRLVLTPQGFLSAFGAMQQMAEKLAEAGILQKK